MLLVETVLTLMTGLFCRPAAMPATDAVASAWSSIDPPIVCRIGDEKCSKKVVVRRSGNRVDDDKPGEHKSDCRVIVKCIEVDGKDSACCGKGPQVFTKVIRLDDGRTDCRKGPGVFMKRIGSDGRSPGCGEGSRFFFKQIGPDEDGAACGGTKRSRIVARSCADGPDDVSAGQWMGSNAVYFIADDQDPLVPGGENEVGTWEIKVDTPPVEAGGPWLGVQFGPVSRPLASHLGLEKGVGEMVLNVVEGSPADKAGLQQYDVIVSIDGKEASADIMEFLAVVQGFVAGEPHKLSLIRAGRPVEATVTIGARPQEMDSAKYKYQMELEELARNDVLQRGGILRKGPGGWAFEGLGNLKNMPKLWQDLPDEEGLRNLLDMYANQPGSECQVIVIRKDKDKSLEIRRDGDQITVTRTTTDEGDGEKKTTTKTYANEEELKKQDAEAYQMIKEYAHGEAGALKKGNRVFITPGGDHLKYVPKDVSKDLKELQKNVEKMHKEAARAQAEARKSAEEGVRQYTEASGDFFAQRKARTSFEVASDGKIRVTTRKGSEELTQTFDNAEAMKKACPDLHAKYLRLRDSGGAGASKD
jgi:hypothetical protein